MGEEAEDTETPEQGRLSPGCARRNPPGSQQLGALPLLCSPGLFSVTPTLDSILLGALQDPGLGRKVELSSKRGMRAAGASGLYGQAGPLQTSAGRGLPSPSVQGYPMCLWVVDQLSHLMRIYFISCEVLCKNEVYTRQGKAMFILLPPEIRLFTSAELKRKKNGLSICLSM